MRSTANKSTTQRMNPSWQSRNFAWNGYWNSSRMDTATIMCRMALYEIRVYTRRSLYVRTFFKSLVATVSDPYQCNRITDALAAAGIKFYCKSKDVNRHNTFDQARIGTLGIKPQYVTEVFVDKENADMALHIIHTLS